MKFSIQIATKNRLADLTLTLSKISALLDRYDVECVVVDDGSNDGTQNFLIENYPDIVLHRNEISQGYLACRNKMLNETKATYTISLDDDAHFLSDNPLEKIETHFLHNPKCGLVAFCIFWNTTAPQTKPSDEKSERVKGFVGCGHAWRMDAWRAIPNYPEWFSFYGEEYFASLHLYKRNIEIHYVPEIFVLHRVDMKARRSNKDFKTRYKNSVKADWYLFFLFYPYSQIPRRMAYSIWMQFKTKILKGDAELLIPLMRAFAVVVKNTPNLVRHRHGLTNAEFKGFLKLKDTKIYWKP